MKRGLLARRGISQYTVSLLAPLNSSTNGCAMKIHEYQAKAILAKFGVPVPRGEVAFTKEDARDAADRLGTPVVVVKAQIHAGGRGKAGGVKLARSPEQATFLADQILGMT